MVIWQEVLGYLGMALVVLSFLFKNQKTLRILNLCGGILCMIYGFLTQTYPTAGLNLALIVINGAMLSIDAIKEYKVKHGIVDEEEDKK